MSILDSLNQPTPNGHNTRHNQNPIPSLPNRRPQSQSLIRERLQGQESKFGERMAKADELEQLETAYYVGRKVPLAEVVPPFVAWLLRKIFFRYRFALAGRDADCFAVSPQAICTTKELAVDMANKPGWFYHQLPINTSLPVEVCTFKEHVFPASPAAKTYKEAKFKVRAIKETDLQRLTDEMDAKAEEVIKAVQIARARL